MKVIAFNMKLISITIAILLAISYLTTLSGVAQGPIDPPAAPEEFTSGEIIIKFRSQDTPQGVHWFLRDRGLTLLESSPSGDLLRIQVEPGGERAAITRLAIQKDIEFATLNYRVHGVETPDDPGYGQLWNLNNTGQTSGTPDADIDAPEAWALHTGRGNITIAIIDSGVDLDHPDLQANLVSGYNFVNDNSMADDDNGHGTHVAGIAAARGNNGLGVAGVSWRAKIMPLKMLDARGDGTVFDLAQAIEYAVDHGADVLNMSLGGTCSRWPAVEDAVAKAIAKDRLLIAASGNGNTTVFCPAAMEGVTAVGATDKFDSRSSVSNYGDDLDIVAPGDFIYSTTTGGRYGYKSGTSMAAPHVAGLAALLWSYESSLTSRQVGDIIRNTSQDLGEVGWDPFYGHGRINAWQALDSLSLQTSATKTLLIDDTTSSVSKFIEITTANPNAVDWTASISSATPWLKLQTPTSGSISSASSPKQLGIVATQPFTYGQYTTTVIITGATSNGFPTTPQETTVNLIYASEFDHLYFPMMSRQSP